MSIERWSQSKPTWVPRPHQLRGLQLLMEHNGARLFLKPGAGKTATVLKAFDILRKQGIVDTLLVLAPLRVVTTSWPQQLNYWKDFEHLTYSIIHGGPDGRKAGMARQADVYLMNVEGLLTKEWKPLDMGASRRQRVFSPNPGALKWLKSKKVMLAVDESTKFKDSSSLRFKTLKTYLYDTCRRIIMTGTPRPGSLEDLFAQCYITDMGDDLGQFVTHFRSRYMMPKMNGRGYDEQPGAMERVVERIAPTTLQINTDEAVERVENEIWIPMPPAVRAQYTELANEFLLTVGDATVMAPNAGVLYGKLRQLAQGAIFDINSQWHNVHELKLDVLENILEELNGEPAFCLYNYSHDYERIERRLKRDIPRIGGGVSAAIGASHARAFSAGAHPLLLGHPQSVALGVDGLQDNCRNIIWFASTPSWEQTYQAELRIARPGNKFDTVYVHRILLECSVERAILAKSRQKSMSEAEFLATLRAQLEDEI